MLFQFTEEAAQAISRYIQRVQNSVTDTMCNQYGEKTSLEMFTSDVEQDIRFLAIRLSRARNATVVKRRDVEKALRKLVVELFRTRKMSTVYYKQFLGDMSILQERVTSSEKPRILDVGCGWGKISRRFSKKLDKKADVVGIDLDVLSLEYGGFLNRDASFVRADMRHLPLKPLAFDVILSSKVLHEVESKDELDNGLREFARTLRRDGSVYVFDPFARFRVVKLIQRILHKVYPKIHILHKVHPKIDRYFQEGEFEDHLKKEKFRIISKSRIVWPISFRVFCSYIAVNT